MFPPHKSVTAPCRASCRYQSESIALSVHGTSPCFASSPAKRLSAFAGTFTDAIHFSPLIAARPSLCAAIRFCHAESPHGCPIRNRIPCCSPPPSNRQKPHKPESLSRLWYTFQGKGKKPSSCFQRARQEHSRFAAPNPVAVIRYEQDNSFRIERNSYFADFFVCVSNPLKNHEKKNSFRIAPLPCRKMPNGFASHCNH